jgi:hypothetical protein
MTKAFFTADPQRRHEFRFYAESEQLMRRPAVPITMNHQFDRRGEHA